MSWLSALGIALLAAVILYLLPIVTFGRFERHFRLDAKHPLLTFVAVFTALLLLGVGLILLLKWASGLE